jgi:HEAT repeat protein
MHCFTHQRHVFAYGPGLVALAAALVWTSLGHAERFANDPVEDLRQDIKNTIRKMRDDKRFETSAEGPTLQEQLKIAQQAYPEVRQRIDRLTRLSDMRRAWQLSDWPRGGTVGFDVSASLLTDDRMHLAQRFRDTITRILKQGNPTSTLAALTLLGEMGVNLRTPEDVSGMVRGLSPDLAELVRHGPTPEIRVAAARALGEAFADPKLAGAAFNELMQKGSVQERRGAAAATVSLVRVLGELISGQGRPQETTRRKDVGRPDIAAVGQAVIPVITRGLGDSDVGVRRLSAEAFQRLAGILQDQTPHTRTAETGGEYEPAVGEMAAARRQFQPLVETFRDNLASLLRSLSDPDLQVRIAAQRAFADFGLSRQRLLTEPAARPAPVPAPGTGGGEREDAPGTGEDDQLPGAGPDKAPPPAQADPMLEVLRGALPALEANLRHPELAIRLGALDILETLGSVAAPSGPALVRAMDDPNRFVRWAAARTVGKLGPIPETKGAVAVLARLLHDEDLDLAVAAAVALERFGPASQPAVADLTWATRTTDAPLRRAAIIALEAIGTGAASAIPALAAVLTDPDPTIRRTAAEALGRFGSVARNTEPALRRVLADEDPEVRRAAAEALLNILGTPGEDR